MSYRLMTRYPSWIFGRNKQAALDIAELAGEYSGIPVQSKVG
jgi:hypothetical protein